MEIGAPMAALYVLQNPDHYKSHEFQVFYWKNFVNYVQFQWERLRDNVELEQGDEDGCDQFRSNRAQDVGIERITDDCRKFEHEGTATVDDDETIRLTRSKGNYVGKGSTDDYRYRPLEHEFVSLYEWVQCSVRQNQGSTRSPSKSLSFYPYLSPHPMSGSHLVACDPERRHRVIPNFIGPALPRKETGESETYFCTMLTLFKPWRTGLDLKSSIENWEMAFKKHIFSDREKELIANFNLRYECYDARDDFAATLKMSSTDCADEMDMDSDFVDVGLYDVDEDGGPGTQREGPAAKQARIDNMHTLEALKKAGWNEDSIQRGIDLGLPRVIVDSSFNSTAWKKVLNAEKELQFKRKLEAFARRVEEMSSGASGSVPNDAA
ncbi:hypothetical protein EST38_g9066 [Candolleomyces aberdarensis]|uniref:Uncharacterized protein n=1 Tax=Candolleomyces aberdarensis TaxID=2316362 RepID=A0A4Q2DD33_9AGAR|nr:hypothetical protein EST38_g9066 [Candolleomyces aberdarensis]